MILLIAGYHKIVQNKNYIISIILQIFVALRAILNQKDKQGGGVFAYYEREAQGNTN